MSISSEKINGKVIEVEIKSSNLKSASYNTETEDLTITFNNGFVYEYSKVPWSLFTKFRMADSQGKFFNLNIAKKYNYKRIE
jgi:hypothetical protein